MFLSDERPTLETLYRLRNVKRYANTWFSYVITWLQNQDSHAIVSTIILRGYILFNYSNLRRTALT